MADDDSSHPQSSTSSSQTPIPDTAKPGFTIEIDSSIDKPRWEPGLGNVLPEHKHVDPDTIELTDEVLSRVFSFWGVLNRMRKTALKKLYYQKLKDDYDKHKIATIGPRPKWINADGEIECPDGDCPDMPFSEPSQTTTWTIIDNKGRIFQGTGNIPRIESFRTITKQLERELKKARIRKESLDYTQAYETQLGGDFNLQKVIEASMVTEKEETCPNELKDKSKKEGEDEGEYY